MEENKDLSVIYRGRVYSLLIDTHRLTKDFFICKLHIGFSHHWLICQRGGWMFIGDLSLCTTLQQLIIKTITKLEIFDCLKGSNNLRDMPSSKRDVIASVILSKLIKVNRGTGKR